MTVDVVFDHLTEIIFVRFLHSEFILFALFPILFFLELDISSLHRQASLLLLLQGVGADFLFLLY